MKIPGAVMAVVGMTSRNYDPVGAIFKGFHQDHEINPACARKTDDLDVGGIFDPACAGKIGSCVGTPVTYESHYFGFKLFHLINN